MFHTRTSLKFNLYVCQVCYLSMLCSKNYQNSYCHVYGSRLDMYVDDVILASDRLQRRFADIAVREDGGLYLGGVPEGLSVEEQAVSSQSLDGCISDLVINRK